MWLTFGGEANKANEQEGYPVWPHLLRYCDERKGYWLRDSMRDHSLEQQLWALFQEKVQDSEITKPFQRPNWDCMELITSGSNLRARSTGGKVEI